MVVWPKGHVTSTVQDCQLACLITWVYNGIEFNSFTLLCLLLFIASFVAASQHCCGGLGEGQCRIVNQSSVWGCCVQSPLGQLSRVVIGNGWWRHSGSKFQNRMMGPSHSLWKVQTSVSLPLTLTLPLLSHTRICICLPNRQYHYERFATLAGSQIDRCQGCPGPPLVTLKGALDWAETSECYPWHLSTWLPASVATRVAYHDRTSPHRATYEEGITTTHDNIWQTQPTTCYKHAVCTATQTALCVCVHVQREGGPDLFCNN